MTRRIVTWFRAATSWVARSNTQPLLFITAACLVIGEQYPFSTFPMYSSFSDSTYYVYLADGADQPLSTYGAIGVSTATFKKMYESALRAEMRRLRVPRKQLTDEQRQALGARVLAELRTSPGALAAGHTTGRQLPDVLRLYEVQVQLAGGELKKETRLIAEQR